MILRKKMGHNFRGISFALVALVLGGCAPGMKLDSPSGEHPVGEMPKGYSLFLLGRDLSQGAVDLFDPYLSFFEKMPDPPKQYEEGLSVANDKFPLSFFYKPADDDVSLYALSLPSDDLEIVDPDPVAVPVPLNPESEEKDGTL